MYIFDTGSASTKESYFKSEKHKDVQCPVHIHYCMELVFVYSGRLIMNVNGRDRVINAGQATLMMPFDQHSFFTPESCTCIVVEFSPKLVEEFYTLVKNKRLINEVFEFDRKAMDFCEGLMPKSSAEELAVKASIYPLCCEMINKCKFEKGRNKLDNIPFIDAVKYISDNYRNEAVTLTAVAKAIGVHHVYLSRIFGRNAGMNFKKYVNLLRCNAAALMIKKEKEKTISEIAFDCGFGSIRSFNRQFAELYGFSPSKFRQNENQV